MSSKPCAKCEKTVYPTEELKCLDKVWHKTCFKCQTCGMALNMKNYKGFDKLPYCGAHVPKAKATIVADTPEMKRLAENSKNQSNVMYHAEFEAAKGKCTQIADDPEIQRIKANHQIVSNVTYHDVVGQKAEQEKKRSLVNSEGLPMGSPTPKTSVSSISSSNGSSRPDPAKMQQAQQSPMGSNQYADRTPGRTQVLPQETRKTSGDYDHQQMMMQQQQYHSGSGGAAHPSGRVSQSSTSSSSSYSQQHSIQARSQPLPPQAGGPPQGPPGGPQGYPQMPAGYGQQMGYPGPGPGPQHQQPPSSSMPAAYARQPSQQQLQQQHMQQQQMQQQQLQQQQLQQQQLQQQELQKQMYRQQQAAKQQQQQQQPPMMRQHSGSGYNQPGYQQQPQHHAQQQQQQQMAYRQQQQQQMQQQQRYGQPQQQQMYQQQPAQPPSSASRGRCYQAMYDYEAQDSDEVSFKDGDLIVNCTPIDEGWMTGTVHRTGKFGMLPANYVEPVNL